MKTLTIKQIKRLQFWQQKVLPLIPSFYGPKPFVKFLSDVLPDYCSFNRTIFWGNKLVCYIPTLCSLNPWYLAIIEHRLAEAEAENVNSALAFALSRQALDSPQREPSEV